MTRCSGKTWLGSAIGTPTKRIMGKIPRGDKSLRALSHLPKVILHQKIPVLQSETETARKPTDRKLQIKIEAGDQIFPVEWSETIRVIEITAGASFCAVVLEGRTSGSPP